MYVYVQVQHIHCKVDFRGKVRHSGDRQLILSSPILQDVIEERWPVSVRHLSPSSFATLPELLAAAPAAAVQLRDVCVAAPRCTQQNTAFFQHTNATESKETESRY